MSQPIRFFTAICIFFLGLSCLLHAAEQKASPPSILSPDLSSVNYLQKEQQEWTLIIADQDMVKQVWIDGEKQEIQPQKTVVIKRTVYFVKGKNTFVVEAEGGKGLKSQRIFTVYYEDDPEKLEAFKNANLPPEERPFATFFTIGGGIRSDSNATHLSDSLASGVTFDDRQASAKSGELTLGYRVKPKGTNRTFQLQYSYFIDAFEDKQIGEAELSDLGLHSHTITGQYTWTQPQQAWSLIYAWSRFNGNAKTDEEDKSTTDNGNVASFHFLVPTYTRVHNESFTSMVLLKLISRSFQEEPEDSDQDRDSSLSVGIDYNLFYYLPSKLGRFKGLAALYNDQAEGKAQRFRQKSLGVSYERSWNFSQWDSDLRWQLITNGRLTSYEEKHAFPTEDSDEETQEPEHRRTLRQTDQIALAWIYQSSLTIQAGYSHIRAFSSIEEFTFSSEVRSLNFSWHSFF